MTVCWPIAVMLLMLLTKKVTKIWLLKFYDQNLFMYKSKSIFRGFYVRIKAISHQVQIFVGTKRGKDIQTYV